MANQRKLGRTADQRKALLRNQVTNLIWYGRIETTESKAKEVRRIADKMITLAIRECENTVSATKETHNDKGQLVTLEVQNDAPSKLHARRIMMAYLYDLKEPKKDTRTRPNTGNAPRTTSIPWWRSCSARSARSIRPGTRRRTAPADIPGFTSWVRAGATPPRWWCWSWSDRERENPETNTK